MSVLSGRQILQRLTETDNRRRLYVTPLLDREALREAAGSLDIRLGTEFVVTRKTAFAAFDPSKPEEELRRDAALYQQRFRVPFGHPIILHPNELVLGATLEYYRFPLDLMGYVIGRSSWGRAGLVIATATMVHPGYTGVLTLELENIGAAPLKLLTGTRVGQIVFHELSPQEGSPISYAEVYKDSKFVANRGPSLLEFRDREADRLRLVAGDEAQK